MAGPDFKSVDDYLAAQPETARGVLEQVRQAIRRAAPDADEMISYKIPAYCLAGKPVLYFAGWKKHFSLYPVDARLLAEVAGDFSGYAVDKGTIRFPLDGPVPLQLIEDIARLRARAVTAAARR